MPGDARPPRRAARGARRRPPRGRRGAAARRAPRGRTRARTVGRPVADRAADPRLAAGLDDEAALDEPGDHGVRRDTAQAGDLGPRARPQVRDDRERLERRLRQAALDRPLDEPRAGLRLGTGGAERVAARDLLEHDPAPPVGVPLAEQMERRLDACLVVLGRPGELGHGQRHGRDHEQRFERARGPLERRGVDETESGRRVGSCSLPFDAGAPDSYRRERRVLVELELVALAQLEQREERRRLLETCQRRHLVVEHEARPAREQRAEPLEEAGDGRERGAACGASETSGGSAASARIAPASASGSCGATRISARGAIGAGPSAVEAVRLRVEPLREPGSRSLDPPVLGEPRGKLLGRLGRAEVGDVRVDVGKQLARLDLEQRADEDEELARRLEVDAARRALPRRSGRCPRRRPRPASAPP